MDYKAKNYLLIKSKVKYFVFLCIYFLFFPLAKLIYGRKRNWLICDRGTDAQDNGFAFFKYLREKQNRINPFYIINKSSPDFNKVAAIGKTVQPGSFKHLLLVAGCPVKISSHLFGYAHWTQLALYYRRKKTNGLHVFLQHGITKNDQPGFYSENCKSLSVFVCGAKPEFDYISNNFHYKNNEVVYTGFSRYDSLEDVSTKNQILFMPTWRRYLEGLNDEEFINTDFYKSWSSLLNDEQVRNECNKTNSYIKFYLHSSLQRYSHLFKGNDVVSIVYFNDEDVQSLLKESKLLVTDFSSVYFDFAYMEKPMVFYQFDEKEYYDEHYSKGYFDYRRDGFGDVCIDEKTAAQTIIILTKKKFSIDERYLERAKENFVYRDKNNCERIFNKIIELL